jgi:O-antigen ligase
MFTSLKRLNFDWQIGLYFLSAACGLLLAFNPPIAAARFAFVLGGIALYFVVANLSDVARANRQLSRLGWLLAVLPVIICVVMLLSVDWSRLTNKISFLQPVAHALAEGPWATSGLALNSNVAGGLLAMLLPMQILALHHTRWYVSVPLIGVTVGGLILSQTRGAWLALALVGALWLVWRLVTRHSVSPQHARMRWLTVATIMIGGLLALIVLTPLGNYLLRTSGDRLNIWRNSIDLVSDYPVTGVGLGGFEMTYAAYALLTHVGHTLHAHNLWLDVWLEQGLIGVMALLGLVLNAVWPKPSSRWRTAALAALAVGLLHGLVDDPFYGYGGAGVVLLLIPLALLIRPPEGSSPSPDFARSLRQPALGVWAVAVTVFLIGLLTPGGRAALAANWGALEQTRQELSVYRWPAIELQDVLRRSPEIDLNSALEYFEGALVSDHNNATANRRLGQIELARGQYAEACRYLSAARTATPGQRAVQQLLGECYAFAGQPEQAVELWRAIDVSEGQLEIRYWWYNDYLQDQEHSAQLQQAIRRFYASE